MNRISKLAGFVIMIYISSTALHAEVELPFDYFYGRWVKGHQVDFNGRWENHAKPTGEMNYRYTSDSWRITLEYIKRGALWQNRNGYLFSPFAGFQTRFGGKWQMGIDSLHFEARPNDQSAINLDRLVDSDKRQRISGRLFIDWLNKRTCEIPEKHAAYFYSVDWFLNRGTLKLDNNLGFNAESKGRMLITEDTAHQYFSVGSTNSHESLIDYRGSIKWGLTDDFQFNGDIELRYRIGESIHYYRGVEQGLVFDHFHSKADRKSYYPSYDLTLTSGNITPVYLRVSFGQSFDAYRTDESKWALNNNADDQLIFQKSESVDLTVYRNRFNISVTYINDGDFDPKIILDDYNGFYHNMLFHKQMKAGIELAHVSVPHDIGYSTELTSDFSIGLFNKCQLDAVWYYLYGHRTSNRFDDGEEYSIITHGRLMMAYRSYEYRPGKGPGWSQDNKYDIVFGAIPEFGQFYIKVTYILPTFHKEADNLDFLTLSDLESNHQSYLETDLIFGLGRNFVIKAHDRAEFRNSAIFFRRFKIQLETRILDRIFVSAVYSQNYRSFEFSGGWINPNIDTSGFDDPEISLKIKGLL